LGKAKFTVSAGDSNTYAIKVEYYWIDPDTQETFATSGESGNTVDASNSPQTLQLSGQKVVNKVGEWVFGVRTFYKVYGSSTWTAGATQHYHVNVYEGGGGG
jgi:hypothetical protein